MQLKTQIDIYLTERFTGRYVVGSGVVKCIAKVLKYFIKVIVDDTQYIHTFQGAVQWRFGPDSFKEFIVCYNRLSQHHQFTHTIEKQVVQLKESCTLFKGIIDNQSLTYISNIISHVLVAICDMCHHLLYMDDPTRKRELTLTTQHVLLSVIAHSKLRCVAWRASTTVVDYIAIPEDVERMVSIESGIRTLNPQVTPKQLEDIARICSALSETLLRDDDYKINLELFKHKWRLEFAQRIHAILEDPKKLVLSHLVIVHNLRQDALSMCTVRHNLRTIDDVITVITSVSSGKEDSDIVNIRRFTKKLAYAFTSVIESVCLVIANNPDTYLSELLEDSDRFTSWGRWPYVVDGTYIPYGM